MRPVNLLPEGERPAAAAKAVNGSSVAVIAALSVLLLAAVAYVLSANQVDSHTAAIAQVRSETEAAQAQVGALGPFQRFAAIKATRLASVEQLADARFDWERLMREIALVLPEGASLTEATASATGAEEDGAAAADPALAGAPTVQLVGCATSQKQVATLLVRLRQLHRAADVTLANSAAQEEALSADGTDSQGDAVAPGDGTAADGCAITHLDFDATVIFAPETAAAPDTGAERAPTRLGGGS